MSLAVFTKHPKRRIQAAAGERTVAPAHLKNVVLKAVGILELRVQINADRPIVDVFARLMVGAPIQWIPKVRESSAGETIVKAGTGSANAIIGIALAMQSSITEVVGGTDCASPLLLSTLFLFSIKKRTLGL